MRGKLEPDLSKHRSGPGIGGRRRLGPGGGGLPSDGGCALNIASAINERAAFSTQTNRTLRSGIDPLSLLENEWVPKRHARPFLNLLQLLS